LFPTTTHNRGVLSYSVRHIVRGAKLYDLPGRGEFKVA
jgi:hypothetical protein